METLAIPVPYKYIGKPVQNIVFDNGVGNWQNLDAHGRAMHGGIEKIWSNMPSIQKVCADFGAECVFSSQFIICYLTADPKRLDAFRNCVNKISHPTSASIPVKPQDLLADILPKHAKSLVAKPLTKIGHLTNTSIVLHEVAGSLELSIYGEERDVLYAKFKCRPLIDYMGGYSIDKMHVPYVVQNLVFGPCKLHLSNLFQQTAVNVYMPPCFFDDTNFDLDTIYLSGDGVQIQVARKILEDIIDKTEIFTKSCTVPLPVIDILKTQMHDQLRDTVTRRATHIQWTDSSTTVKVFGVNRKAVEGTISSIMHLATNVYSILVSCPNIQSQLLNVVKSGSIASTDGDRMIISGSALQCKEAAAYLSEFNSSASIVFQLELSVQLRDFLAGKKNGKILKIMTATNTSIWFETLHDYNFRVLLACRDPKSAGAALAMLEEELPEEAELFIPEPYHKQIIGAGGQRIQSLMRRYNVYIKFEASNEQVSNAFGNLQTDNVLLRCPRKHSRNLRAAVQDLLNNANQCALEHNTTYLRLTRNHRRLLISHYSNMLRDIEKWSDTVIKYPKVETRGTELVELTGLGQASIQAAKTLQERLTYDYEFRVALSPNFNKAVGPESTFALRVTAPLRIAFDAHVQAFERIQVEGEAGFYAQIMITLPHEDEYAMQKADEIVTSYLRDHALDIIEKGELSTELIVDGTAATAVVASPKKMVLSSLDNVTPLKSKDSPSKFKFVGNSSVGSKTPITPTPRLAGNVRMRPPTLSWKYR